MIIFFQENILVYALGEPDQMVVTWVTLDATNSSIVEYGENNFDEVAKGKEDTFIDGGSEARHIYMHRVILERLNPSSKYSK